jgi:hypothetical protein
MNAAITIALQILSFLFNNKDTIIQVIKDIEGLIPDAPGGTKAAAVKGFIASAIGVEAEIERGWPIVSPIFNALVALVKGKPVPVVPPPAA